MEPAIPRWPSRLYSRRVVALDLTPHMLEQVEQLAAERGLSHIETRQGDVEQIPFATTALTLWSSRYSAITGRTP